MNDDIIPEHQKKGFSSLVALGLGLSGHIAMLVYSMERLLVCQELSVSLVMNGVFGR